MTRNIQGAVRAAQSSWEGVARETVGVYERPLAAR